MTGEPHDKRTIDRAVNVLDDHDYASLGREVRRLQADHDRLREQVEGLADLLSAAMGNMDTGYADTQRIYRECQEALRGL